MRVLLTRPAPESLKSAQQLQAAGHEAIVSPVIRIEATGAHIPDTKFDGLLATSAHAFANAPSADSEASDLRALPLYLVGERTAVAARASKFRNIAIVAADAAELSEFLLRKVSPPSHFLYLAGEDRKPRLEDSLKAGGHRVEIAVTYRATPADNLAPDAVTALRAGNIDAVAHFSRRSAEIFVRLARAAGLAEASRQIMHLCLSPDVAAGLDALGPIRVKIAPKPDFASLIGLLGSSAD